jgi:hypothetical protein
MKRFSVIASAFVMLSVLGASNASATTATQPVARLGSTTIDLSTGWGAAKGCFVQQDGDAQCFTTVAAMKAAEAQLLTGTSSSEVSPETSCSSNLELFSGASFTGSEFDILANGYWLNLSSYGFADVTVSLVNGGCQSYLAQGTNGGTPWYSNSGPYVAVSNMGLYWNDTIKSVYIA